MLHEEACKLESEAQHLETEGLEKMEMAVTGSEAECFYGVLRGAVSHSSLSNPHLLLRRLAMPLTPPFPSAPSGIQRTQSLCSCIAGTGIYLFNYPFSFRKREIPAEMQPLCIQLGVSKECTEVRLRVAGRAHKALMLPFVLMCAGYTWEWGWCAPSATNPSSTQTHSGITRRVT